MTDKNGDGMIGATYYNRGHVTFKRNVIVVILGHVAAIAAALIVLIVLGAMLNVKPAQRALEMVIAGKSTPIVEQMRSE